jgi:tRNA(fMet)-specific endonuclease VapC
MRCGTGEKNRGGPSPVNKSLLDTDILSEIGKAIDPVVVHNATAYRQAFGRYTLSAVSVTEVVRGFQKKQSVRRLQDFVASLASMEVIPLTESAAVLAGKIAGELERLGRPIGIADSMIAAIALEHGLELATGNTAHFQRVQQLGYPLTLVNWRI